MKIYLIKHKGKTWWANLIGLSAEVTLSNKYAMNCGRFFFRKKDAREFLKTYEHSKYLEIVSAEVAQCKKDNRKSL